jgi:hypothetical protein
LSHVRPCALDVRVDESNSKVRYTALHYFNISIYFNQVTQVNQMSMSGTPRAGHKSQGNPEGKKTKMKQTSSQSLRPKKSRKGVRSQIEEQPDEALEPSISRCLVKLSINILSDASPAQTNASHCNVAYDDHDAYAVSTFLIFL